MKKERPNLARAFVIREPSRRFKQRSKGMEAALEREIRDALNKLGWGYFFRLRAGKSFDEIQREFRSNLAEPGVPNLLGNRKGDARAVYIACRYQKVISAGKGGELKIPTKHSRHEKAFLEDRFREGALVGIAYCLEDAQAIVAGEDFRYPRHPRTFAFLGAAELQAKAATYKAQKKALAEARQDPLRRDVDLATPQWLRERL